VVWRHDESLSVTVSFKLKLGSTQERVREVESRNLRGILASLQRWLSTPMEVVYELDVTGRAGDFCVLRENLLVDSKDLRVTIDTARNTFTITQRSQRRSISYLRE